MPSSLRHLPNAITLLRAVLIPVIAAALLIRRYELALLVFAACAAGDFIDGWLARRFDVRTRFGAIADPLADKLTMLTVTALLALQGWLAWWFAALVIARDLVIVGGAVVYHLRIGQVEMAPTRISKVNTALEFLLLAGVLAAAAAWLERGPWLDVLLWTASGTIIVSGMQYVVLWSRKAAAATRQFAR